MKNADLQTVSMIVLHLLEKNYVDASKEILREVCNKNTSGLSSNSPVHVPLARD